VCDVDYKGLLTAIGNKDLGVEPKVKEEVFFININLRHLKWDDVKKRLFRFIGMIAIYSLLGFVFDYYFRPSINYGKVISIALGASFGVVFFDLLFLKNKNIKFLD